MLQRIKETLKQHAAEYQEINPVELLRIGSDEFDIFESENHTLPDEHFLAHRWHSRLINELKDASNMWQTYRDLTVEAQIH
ncbi:MAG: hypothetical protein K9N48_07550 [Verrucomicrobia bacterium]|nr:hypothetical protein [Verrucomicrobiota bacterium]